MQILTWGTTDPGRVRKNNEDSFVIDRDLGLAMVADGMGGLNRGEVASALACSVVKETITAARDKVESYRRAPNEENRLAILAVLEDALSKACEEVFEAGESLGGEGGRMGTTMDVLLVAGTTAFLAHVGDGRVFLLRGGEAHQLTEDHTLIAEQLRDGQITEEEAKVSRYQHVITRALGAFPSVEVDRLAFELDQHDRFLLCSDGLHRYVQPRELGFLMDGELDDNAASCLIDLANERGGKDNITAVLCTADREAPAEFVPPARDRMDVLRRVDLFQTCTYRELMHLCQITEQRDVPSGTVLFRDGEPGRECFFIVSGVIAIEKQGTRLAWLGPANYFGELSLFELPRRSADAVAIEDSAVLVMNKDRLLQLMKQDSDLAGKLMWQLLHKLARTIRETNEQLVAETMSLDGERSDGAPAE